MIDLSEIINEINERIVDNTQQEIDAADVREPMVHLAEDLESYLSGVYSIPEINKLFKYDKCLKFTATTSNCAVRIEKNGSAPDVSIEFSTDGWSWARYNAALNGNILLRSVGDFVMFKGSNKTFATSESDHYYFVVTGDVEASGDITSLLNDVGGDVALEDTYTFTGMFQGCTTLLTAPKLPSTRLSEYCYSNMFRGCRALRQAPMLPALTLADSCYSGMFQGCVSMIQPPELPAMTLANNCYSGMFKDCTGMSKGPELPAVTLFSGCYDSMFAGCSTMTESPILPALTLVKNCYINMFAGCRSLQVITAMFKTTPSNTLTNDWVNGVARSGLFTMNAEAQWEVGGNIGIPTGWDVDTI